MGENWLLPFPMGSLVTGFARCLVLTWTVKVFSLTVWGKNWKNTGHLNVFPNCENTGLSGSIGNITKLKQWAPCLGWEETVLKRRRVGFYIFFLKKRFYRRVGFYILLFYKDFLNSLHSPFPSSPDILRTHFFKKILQCKQDFWILEHGDSLLVNELGPYQLLTAAYAASKG